MHNLAFSDGGYALRCPRDPDHVTFNGVVHMRAKQRVVVDWDCNIVDRELAECVEIIRDPMDASTPLCARCGAPAMIGRPPAPQTIEEEIEF